uniref:Uncharacterized protein n=1 Tax=Meloidogyne incognita TaxID=6306 RepID=A0A914M8S8_MELIC
MLLAPHRAKTASFRPQGNLMVIEIFLCRSCQVDWQDEENKAYLPHLSQKQGPKKQET